MSDSTSSAVFYCVRPAALRRDRLIVAFSNGLPFIGLVVGIWQLLVGNVTVLDAALFFGMYAVSMTGMEVGFHRYFSHKAFEATRGVRMALAIAGCTCGQGPVTSWVANHRMHHSFADRDGDTHSPHQYQDQHLGLFRGMWHAQVGWLFRPERAVPGHYARDLLSDKVIRRIDALYFLWVGLGLAFPALIGGVATGTLSGAWGGFLWGGLVRTCLIQQFTYAINSIAHRFGRRPFQTGDQATNSWILAIPTFGIGWHNNHHAFPYTAKNCFEWWQVDISWGVLMVLKRLGWVWNLKVPSGEMLAAKRRKTKALPLA